MNTPPNTLASIRDRLADAPEGSQRFLWGATASVCLGDLFDGTSPGSRVAELAGRTVLVATRDQFAAALALIELDGIARRLIVCTPDLPAEHLPAIVAKANVDVVLTFASLTAPIVGALGQGAGVVWGTFYDIRRYGGLQIFLRAVLGRGSFVLSDAGESIGEYLVRLGAHGATHVSGTPTHWRRALMSPDAGAIAPRYIRLSGEIADQAILNALRSFYPQASVGHAFASTEAGVGFEVNDGLEGFPAGVVDAPGEVQIKVEDGSLRIRSARTAMGYVGEEHSALTDDAGFVDTGDMVERRGDRYYFLGRRSGIINVGGLKVHPEEVEAAINRHPAVRMSMVRSRKSPLIGSLVAADVVLNGATDPSGAGESRAGVRREILQICHERLAPHKIPATIRFVPALEIAAAGKVARHA
jgi:acyl-coenzyme A synthetase/AMP-(fatty) acid ligase